MEAKRRIGRRKNDSMRWERAREKLATIVMEKAISQENARLKARAKVGAKVGAKA